MSSVSRVSFSTESSLIFNSSSCFSFLAVYKIYYSCCFAAKSSYLTFISSSACISLSYAKTLCSSFKSERRFKLFSSFWRNYNRSLSYYCVLCSISRSLSSTNDFSLLKRDSDSCLSFVSEASFFTSSPILLLSSGHKSVRWAPPRFKVGELESLRSLRLTATTFKVFDSPFYYGLGRVFTFTISSVYCSVFSKLIVASF